MQSFTARIERDSTELAHHYVRIPDEVAQALGAVKRMRVRGTANGEALNRCLYTLPGDVFIILLGNHFLSKLRVKTGHEVRFALEPDPDPNHVELPEELEAALDQIPEAQAKFMAMTPGKRRSLAIYVDTAKHVDTRIKRALELCHKIQTNTLYSQRNKSK